MMKYRERIETKVGILFQIADQYLSGQMPPEQAKELIGLEMARIRPAQFEAVKAELGARLKEPGRQANAEKLFALFRNYLSPPFHKLPNGHPIRNYYEENCSARSYLLRIDEMEEEEAEPEAWAGIYEGLNGFRVHLRRQEKNFYPLLIPKDMRLQVEKAKELGTFIFEELENNRGRLENGNLVDFLYHQRTLCQTFMSYLDLEERALYPKALMSFTEQDFAALRSADDQEGYAFIGQPPEFLPGLQETAVADPGLLLSAVLAAKEMRIISYSLSGEVVSVMGEPIPGSDLEFPQEIRRRLLSEDETARGEKGKPEKFRSGQGDQTVMITYSVLADARGNRQGLLKTIERLGGIEQLSGVELPGGAEERAEGQPARGIDASQNIAELFQMYPKFREDFFLLDEELNGLKGPFGMDLLKDSSVEMIARSLRIDPADLMERINQLLKSY